MPCEIVADSASYRLGGGVVPPRDTRYSTVPWAGTLALIAPVVVRFAFVQRSFSVYDAEPPRPIAAAVVLIVAVAVGLVEQRHRAVAVGQSCFDDDVPAAGLRDDRALPAERVLVDGDHVGVLEDRERVLVDLAQVGRR